MLSLPEIELINMLILEKCDKNKKKENGKVMPELRGGMFAYTIYF
jgi:hypothetical protein